MVSWFFGLIGVGIRLVFRWGLAEGRLLGCLV
jgi:hypothetical protein